MIIPFTKTTTLPLVTDTLTLPLVTDTLTLPLAPSGDWHLHFTPGALWWLTPSCYPWHPLVTDTFTLPLVTDTLPLAPSGDWHFTPGALWSLVSCVWLQWTEDCVQLPACLAHEHLTAGKHLIWPAVWHRQVRHCGDMSVLQVWDVNMVTCR